MDTKKPEEVQWDVALEALLNEQFREHGDALNMAALTHLADHHNIRLDDILDTLCKLTDAGAWAYEDKSGAVAPPDSDMCRLLKANHRLNELQLDRMRGRWRPSH